ncbi:MAG: RNA polymerase factor sigma-54 [Paludibacteraceae bacterium]|nr:RNA polymerase factor sigma-54 [Paludibacteraceae bacterium]
MSDLKQASLQTQQQGQQQRTSLRQIVFQQLLECTNESLEQRVTEEVEKNPALDADAYTSGEVTDTENSDAGTEEGDFESDNETNADNEERLSAEEMEDVMQGDDGYYEAMDTIHVAGRADETGFHQYEVVEGAYEMLKNQLSFRPITELQRQLCEYLVDSLDEKGFLTRQPDEIMDDYFNLYGVDVSLPEIEAAIGIIKTLEPIGVGACDTQECLLMQLSAMAETKEVILLRDILQNCYRQLVNQNFDAIQSRLGIGEDQFKSVLGLLNELNPKPLLSLQENALSDRTITPELILNVNEGDISISLTDVKLPPLRLSAEYQSMSQDSDAKVRNFAKQYIEMAEDFMEALRLRDKTLLLIMTAIAEKQRDYFLTGDSSHLLPMVLQDIAEVTNLDQSTVSRATSNKYVQTPFGVKSLRTLFTASVKGEDGEMVSRNKVLADLRAIIDSEDKSSPYTDDQLSALLLERGYNVKRRTVSKYRGELGIGTVQMRKVIR